MDYRSIIDYLNDVYGFPKKITLKALRRKRTWTRVWGFIGFVLFIAVIAGMPKDEFRHSPYFVVLILFMFIVLTLPLMGASCPSCHENFRRRFFFDDPIQAAIDNGKCPFCDKKIR